MNKENALWNSSLFENANTTPPLAVPLSKETENTASTGDRLLEYLKLHCDANYIASLPASNSLKNEHETTNPDSLPGTRRPHIVKLTDFFLEKNQKLINYFATTILLLLLQL